MHSNCQRTEKPLEAKLGLAGPAAHKTRRFLISHGPSADGPEQVSLGSCPVCVFYRGLMGQTHAIARLYFPATASRI